MPARGHPTGQDWTVVTFASHSVPRATRSVPCAPTVCASGLTAGHLDTTDELRHHHVAGDLRRSIMQARASRGWSQKDLARQLGCAVVQIREYESGAAIPVNAFVARMERTLGCTLPRARK